MGSAIIQVQDDILYMLEDQSKSSIGPVLVFKDFFGSLAVFLDFGKEEDITTIQYNFLLLFQIWKF